MLWPRCKKMEKNEWSDSLLLYGQFSQMRFDGSLSHCDTRKDVMIFERVLFQRSNQWRQPSFYNLHVTLHCSCIISSKTVTRLYYIYLISQARVILTAWFIWGQISRTLRCYWLLWFLFLIKYFSQILNFKFILKIKNIN